MSDLAVRITLVDPRSRHSFGDLRVEPPLGSLRHATACPASKQLPWRVADAKLVKMLGGDFAERIKVSELELKSTGRSNCACVEVVLETSFLRDDGTAVVSSIDDGRGFKARLCLGWEFVIEQKELGTGERGKTMRPGLDVAASERQEDRSSC